MRLSVSLAIASFVALTCSSTTWAQHADDGCLSCDVFKPRWFASGAVVFMDRVTEDPDVLMQNVANPGQQLNAEDFQFGWKTGFDVSLNRRYWDESGYEIRYLDLGQFDQTTTVATGGGTVRIDAMPPIFAANVQTIAARYQSEMRTVEANYHHAIHDEYLVHVGLRYVSLDESLTSVLDANPQVFDQYTATRNDLYGAQVGASGAICEPLFGCIPIWGSAKMGVYANDADHHSWVNTGAATVAIAESTGEVAYLGEFGISARRTFGDLITIHGGYGLLWLGNVAVASDQLSESDFFNGRGSDDRGDVIFHGARFAIELWL